MLKVQTCKQKKPHSYVKKDKTFKLQNTFRFFFFQVMYTVGNIHSAGEIIFQKQVILLLCDKIFSEETCYLKMLKY